MNPRDLVGERRRRRITLKIFYHNRFLVVVAFKTTYQCESTLTVTSKKKKKKKKKKIYIYIYIYIYVYVYIYMYISEMLYHVCPPPKVRVNSFLENSPVMNSCLRVWFLKAVNGSTNKIKLK